MTTQQQTKPVMSAKAFLAELDGILRHNWREDGMKLALKKIKTRDAQLKQSPIGEVPEEIRLFLIQFSEIHSLTVLSQQSFDWIQERAKKLLKKYAPATAGKQGD